MNTSESDTLKAYIERIISETESRSMKWAKTNPTTYQWTKPRVGQTPGAQLTLQRVVQKKLIPSHIPGYGPQQISVANFIFQAFELPTTLKLAVNTQTDDDLRKLIGKLYAAITATIDQEGMDFLKQVIGG